MRNLHRWISSAAMLFLAWVAVTGVVLAVDTLYPPAALRAPPAAPAVTPDFAYDHSAAPLDRAAIEAQLATSIRTALADARGGTLTAMDLQLRNEQAQPRATVVLTSDREQTLNIDAAQGRLLSTTTVWKRPDTVAVAWYDDVPLRLHWHELIQDLHRGSIIGISGQVMDILTGLSFAILSFTGIVMYFRMLGARRRTGRSQAFWR